MAGPQKPEWLRKKVFHSGRISEVLSLLKEKRLNTVCQGARCPNLSECFDRGTATFMILGDVCSRACTFCAVEKGIPAAPSPEEPENVARAVVELNLSHAVVTSVTRDDLPDGGAAHFAATIRAVRALNPDATVEILTPDFKGNFSVLEVFKDANPDIFNHNLETVPSLYAIRPGASYERSLALLRAFKERFPGVTTKSGLMAGLGETRTEMCEALSDLRKNGCDCVTIGQYLSPSAAHAKVEEYVTPGSVAFYGDFAGSLGFAQIFSAPFVRSSYRAAEMTHPHPQGHEVK